MKKVVAEPSWGAQIIEDTDNHELSLQCLCGGIAMYYQRIVLTAEEADEFRAGSLDIDTLVYSLCKGISPIAERCVQSFPVEDLTDLPKGKPAP